MPRRLLQLILALSFLMPASLFAQNSRLNGTWIAPKTTGLGPAFLSFTFRVDGNTFAGAVSNTGKPADRFSDGKIEDGHISFALSEDWSYKGTLKDDKHLDMIAEFHTTGDTLVRKPGTKASTNPLEGEWVWQIDPSRATFVFNVQGDKLTGEVRDRFKPRADNEVLADVPEQHPLTEGVVHGNNISFQYINIWRNQTIETGTLAGDHLVMNSVVKQPLKAVRLADSSGKETAGETERGQSNKESDQQVERAAKIDKLVSAYNEYDLFTGAVLVTDRDRIVFKKGYGFANREWAIPNATDTKFRIGSISKQFTSMLVMQQVEAGTIRLDAHITDYLPYYRKDTGSRVTIQQLLSHTSGIRSYTDDPNFFTTVALHPYAPDEFVKQFCSGELEFEPGTKYAYDNSGYFILATIIEHATGKNYEALFKEKILDPLGMKNTGYDHWEEILPKRASGYRHDLAGDINAPYADLSVYFGQGNLYSTIEDFYLWDQGLYTDKLLRPDLKAKMFTPGLGGYGYGWKISTVPPGQAGGGQTVVDHDGGVNGFNTFEQRYLRDHVLIVVLNNTPSGNVREIADGIRNILYDQNPAMPRRSLQLILGPIVAARGADAAVVKYAELKRADPSGYKFIESELDFLGHRLLRGGRTQDAIAIFRLNAEEYPKSDSVYENLGEAYEQDGQKQRAIENYQRSLAINAKNQHAKDSLKHLEGK